MKSNGLPFAVLTVLKRSAKNLNSCKSSTSGVRSPTQIEQSRSPAISLVLWWFNLNLTGWKYKFLFKNKFVIHKIHRVDSGKFFGLPIRKAVRIRRTKVLSTSQIIFTSGCIILAGCFYVTYQMTAEIFNNAEFELIQTTIFFIVQMEDLIIYYEGP